MIGEMTASPTYAANVQALSRRFAQSEAPAPGVRRLMALVSQAEQKA